MEVNNYSSSTSFINIKKTGIKTDDKKELFQPIYVNKTETTLNIPITKFDKMEKNIPSSNENLVNRAKKIQEYFKNDYIKFDAVLKEHNRRVREDENYDPQKDSKYFNDKKLYYNDYILLNDELTRISSQEWSIHESIYQRNNPSLEDDWAYQIHLIQTDDNKYEDAPEFEAFVNKWMDKGLTEKEAQIRARLYAHSGLLDYGKQKVLEIADYGYGDKKQHGMHLINNDALKNALIETYDTLDNDKLDLLVGRLFAESEHKPLTLEKRKESMLQNLIDEFGSKFDINIIDDSKEGTFDGNINLSETMSQKEKNFIYDVLIEYFKYHINQVEIIEEEFNEEMTELKKSLNLLIENFEKNVVLDNQNNKILSEYTKNSRHNPLQHL